MVKHRQKTIQAEDLIDNVETTIRVTKGKFPPESGVKANVEYVEIIQQEGVEPIDFEEREVENYIIITTSKAQELIEALKEVLS